MSLGLALLAPLGCRTEHPPSRQQLESEDVARIAATPVGPSPVSHVDDANRVLARCGSPMSDEVLSVFNKLQNGPMRRMTYTNGQDVTLDFIPAIPVAHASNAQAMMQRPGGGPVPSPVIWHFNEAHMQQQDMLTAKRLAFYLPCAAAALYPEN
jgi:hypothetical protein